MARGVGRVVRWVLILAVIDVVLRVARRERLRRRPEPAIEPAWPALKIDEPAAPIDAEETPGPGVVEPTMTIDVDEPPAAMAVETSWVAAEADGACPDGFPIKVKERSGIYHAVGMLNYERTTPDRCYASEAAAEAHGFRPAKR